MYIFGKYFEKSDRESGKWIRNYGLHLFYSIFTEKRSLNSFKC